MGQKVSFIKFLAELYVDPEDEDAVQRVRNAKRLGPDKAARQDALRADAEAKLARTDDTVSPQEKKLAQDEARIARQREMVEKRKRAQQQQNESCEYEVVYVDSNNEILTEASIRQFKRVGQEIKKRYRCLAGPKAGKLVAKPDGCAGRKDPGKVRQGRKVMRSKKGVIKRKSKLSKNKAISRLVTKMNKRLSGKL